MLHDPLGVRPSVFQESETSSRTEARSSRICSENGSGVFFPDYSNNNSMIIKTMNQYDNTVIL